MVNNSKTSAAKYSKTAARYTGAPAPTLGIVSFAEKSVDTTDWELKSSTG